MTTQQPIIPMYPWQVRGIRNPARFTHNRRARQTGKSHEAAYKAAARGLGIWREGRPPQDQILLSASEMQSVELSGKCRLHLQAMKVACEYLEDDYFEGLSMRQRVITLPTGKRIIALAANPRTARGYTGDVTLDEFALHADSDEIWAALFPIVTRGDLCLDIYSTPKGKKNAFYRLEENAAFDHSVLTIYDAVAEGLPVNPEELREALGDEDMWRQEYLCEYLDYATAYLTYEEIQACEDAALTVPYRPEAGNTGELLGIYDRLRDELSTPLTGELALGVDVGRRKDLTVYQIIERVGRVYVTRAIVEAERMRFAVQREMLDGLMGLPSMHRAAIDSTGLGAQLAEEAQERWGDRVEPIVFTPQSKSMLATRLRTAVEDRLLRIPVDRKLRDDWHAIQRTVTAAGNVIFDAERTRDGHSDRFWAAALAVYAISERGFVPMTAGRLGGVRRGAALARAI